eukprot:TRINITY_DN30869_c0_g1_i1.p1 TRINITY_DN30869_c0_g1~~TRINITY_DN30869_c0_g1_i1.p1  ORF type:complete len:384 (+),score=120.10 TRINITY_DN30869_c0_g1_i1:48-1154(+)
MGKKKGGKTAAPATSTDGSEVRGCSDCGEKKVKDEYTASQWKKAERRCKACVAEEEKLLAPATEKAARMKEEAKLQKEKEEEARREKMASSPETETARERKIEIAYDKIIQKKKAECSLDDYRSFAKLLSCEVPADSDIDQMISLLYPIAHSYFIGKPASFRALSSSFISSCSHDDLVGLACELDTDLPDSATESEIITLIRQAAKNKSNTRMCESCEKFKTKKDFGQNQWKRDNGSRCKDCMNREAEEKKMLDDYAKMYGFRPGQETEEEHIYTSQHNLYETLGVPDQAGYEEMKKAYRKLAVKYHPDRWASTSEEQRTEAEEQFKLISEAYETLSNPEKKKNYDKVLQRKQRKEKKKADAAQSSEA